MRKRRSKISHRHRKQGGGSAVPILILVALGLVAGVAYLLAGGGGAVPILGDPLAPLSERERTRLGLEAAEELHLRDVERSGRRAAETQQAMERQVARARAEVDVLERLRARARALVGNGDRELWAEAVRRILERQGGSMASMAQRGVSLRDEVLDQLLREEVTYLQQRYR